mmetsp:Transcript_52914/g.146924  ORF Transcript_52914/g.146924 Transcript_52914/m.146924 type:complete len:352 (+) Transcript_52914:1049-2104(+)
MGALLCAAHNHVAQRTQRLVDGLRLLQGLPRCARLGDPLRSGEIDQMKLTPGNLATHAVGRLNCHIEHQVRAARVFVHIGRGHTTVLIGQVQQLKHLLDCADGHPCQVGHVVALVPLPDLEPLRPHILRQQVADLLAINLEDRHLDLVLDLRRPLPGLDKKLLQRARVDAAVVGRSHHRVSFTRARLPVGEDADVVSVEDGRDHGADFLVHALLCRLEIEALVELPVLLLAPIVHHPHAAITALHSHAHAALAIGLSLVELAARGWATPAEDPDVALELLDEVEQPFPLLQLARVVPLQVLNALDLRLDPGYYGISHLLRHIRHRRQHALSLAPQRVRRGLERPRALLHRP